MGIAVIASLSIGCASSMLQFAPADLDPGKYVRKVDQFVVIADGSQSMGDRSDAQRKLDIAEAFLASMNQTVPEMGYTGALRTFGRGSCTMSGKTVLLAGASDYSTTAFLDAINDYECAGGYSPLHLAIDAVGRDLSAHGKPTAVIIVSDGRHMNDKVVTAARNLASDFGSSLDIYAIQVGDDAKGRRLLDQVVSAGGSGYLKPADELTTSSAMGQFVEDVFLLPDSDGDGVPDDKDKCPNTPKGVEVDAQGCPLDTDGDGVPDHLDRCPNTPRGVAVDAKGCPVDSDGDGVPDYLDKCPDTPQGVKVDAKGCPLDSDGDGVPDHLDKCPNTPKNVPVDANGCPPKGLKAVGGEWVVEGNIFFDTNKASVKPEAEPILKQVAEYLKKNQQWQVEIQGHTDSTGSRAWNMKLSQKRAEAVKQRMVEYGVAAERFEAKGYGPDEPIADNSTAEGRAKNRRVDFAPKK